MPVFSACLSGIAPGMPGRAHTREVSQSYKQTACVYRKLTDNALEKERDPQGGSEGLCNP